ncbi:MAG: acetyl-CoA C-acetyltransferase [Candidatus Latescibacterota bacterium]|jgi:acetyl-CoA C-acetyltransferase
MHEVVIVGAVRTAIGKLGGAVAEVPAVELGAVVVRESLRRTGVSPEEVDEVILGHVVQAGCGLNPARQASLKAGLPVTVPATTVNKVCASGMKAVALACQAVATGEARVVVAGGMESMSGAPFLLRRARWGYRLGDDALADAILSDALHDPSAGCHMGITAENLATEFSISRTEQDAFAAESQRKAAAAQAAGAFAAEIVPVEVPQRCGPSLCFAADEFIRPDTTPQALAALKPAFQADGTVTAGNSSGINDGAAAMVLMSRDEAERRGIQPLARVVSWASAGVEPERMGLGPVPASRVALKRAGLEQSDLELVELNEAFAAQALAVLRQLDPDPARVNVNGGAIALGHPVGASGARILVTLLHALAQRQARRGLASLCVGGGQGMAMVVERL